MITWCYSPTNEPSQLWLMYLDGLNRPIIQFYTFYIHETEFDTEWPGYGKCAYYRIQVGTHQAQNDPPLTRRIRHISEERLVHFSQISLHFLSTDP